MSRPTHPLKHEHRVIEQVMRALEGMCLRMVAGASVPDEEMSKLLDFIRNFIDQYHHGKEEAYLFPALEKLGVRDEAGPLAFLRGEHETERSLLAELNLAVEDCRRNQAANERFVSASLQLKDHLIEHMEKEDTILFRIVEDMLDEGAKESLARIFAEENAKAGEMAHRYEQLATELERAWAL